jgi:hypothetical protein
VRVNVALSGGDHPVVDLATPPPPPALPQAEPTRDNPTLSIDSQPSELAPEASPAPAALVLAVIGDKVITDQDVTRELWLRRGQDALDWLIGQAVLVDELDRHGLGVDAAEVESRLAEHLEKLAQAFPRAGSGEQLTRVASGMGLSEYRERAVWTELALRKIMQATLKPGETELRAFFAEHQPDFVEPERVFLEQVFIPPQTGEDSDAVHGVAEWNEAERLAVEAHTRLRMGEDFRAVAASYPGSDSEPVWVSQGELLRELDEAAFALRPGAISNPIRTGMGYHIIQVVERRKRRMPSFDEVRGKVLAQYEERLFTETAGDFLTLLKDQSIKEKRLVLPDPEQP